MATNTAQAGAPANPAESTDAFTQAFMAAWRGHCVVEEIDTVDGARYEASLNALTGALDRALSAGIDHGDHAAITLLEAFSRLGDLIHGCHSEKDLEADVVAQLCAAREGLRMAWRYLDQCGASAVRDYAVFVGAPERQDLVRWEREGVGLRIAA